MLSKFCFFLSLSTGTLIIGVINVLYGLLSLVVQIRSGVHPPTAEEMVTAERAVDIVYTEDSLFTMQFIFGMYLIYGTLKEKQAFLFASMVLHMAFVGYSAFFVAFAILTMLRNSTYTSELSLPNGEQIANEALKIPLFMYFVFIIYGRHEELVIKSPTLMEPLGRRNNDSDQEEINFS